MPSERLQKKTTIAEGGLVETLDVLSLTRFPGRLAVSNNYEVGLSGGYRRIDGYVKYSTTEVSGTGAILGAAVFNSGVVVAREHASSGNTEVFFGTGSSWGSKINSDTRTAQGKHRFWRYNWNGTESIIGCDGGQYAFKYDGSTYTVLNGTGSPANPKFVTEFKDHMFFAGYSANSSGIIFSAPADETKFLTIDGGGEIIVGDEIMNIHVFRDMLIIFCKHSLHKLTGSSMFDFKVEPITERLGCLASDSIVELGGELLFLAPDGIRTIAATEKIGDIELASLTRDIQKRIADCLSVSGSSNVVAVGVRTKNHYRMFCPTSSISVPDAAGIILGLRKNSQGQLVWEAGALTGFKPSVVDSDFVGDDELVIHGSLDDGFIFKQESGNTFNGANIPSSMNFVDDDFGDDTVRKVFHRLHMFYKPEGPISLTVKAILDYGDESISQPLSFTITSGGGIGYYSSSSLYGTATYGTPTGAIQKHQHLIGSGIALSLQILSEDTNPSHSIQGYQTEFVIGDRR